MENNVLLYICIVKFIFDYSNGESSLDCTDWKGEVIANGYEYIPKGDDACTKCRCADGHPTPCHSVSCSPPNCVTYEQIKGECCKFLCVRAPGDSPELQPPTNDNDWKNSSYDKPTTLHTDRANLSLRLVASSVTTMLILVLMLFMVHRLRQRRLLIMMRRMQRAEEEEDGGAVPYITDLNAVQLSCPPYDDPPPPYTPPKPTDFVAPPPYQSTERLDQLNDGRIDLIGQENNTRSTNATEGGTNISSAQVNNRPRLNLESLRGMPQQCTVESSPENDRNTTRNTQGCTSDNNPTQQRHSQSSRNGNNIGETSFMDVSGNYRPANKGSIRHISYFQSPERPQSIRNSRNFEGSENNDISTEMTAASHRTCKHGKKKRLSVGSQTDSRKNIPNRMSQSYTEAAVLNRTSSVYSDVSPERHTLPKNTNSQNANAAHSQHQRMLDFDSDGNLQTVVPQPSTSSASFGDSRQGNYMNELKRALERYSDEQNDIDQETEENNPQKRSAVGNKSSKRQGVNTHSEESDTKRDLAPSSSTDLNCSCVQNTDLNEYCNNCAHSLNETKNPKGVANGRGSLKKGRDIKTARIKPISSVAYSDEDEEANILSHSISFTPDVGFSLDRYVMSAVGKDKVTEEGTDDAHEDTVAKQSKLGPRGNVSLGKYNSDDTHQHYGAHGVRANGVVTKKAARCKHQKKKRDSKDYQGEGGSPPKGNISMNGRETDRATDNSKKHQKKKRDSKDYQGEGGSPPKGNISVNGRETDRATDNSKKGSAFNETAHENMPQHVGKANGKHSNNENLTKTGITLKKYGFIDSQDTKDVSRVLLRDRSKEARKARSENVASDEITAV